MALIPGLSCQEDRSSCSWNAIRPKYSRHLAISRVGVTNGHVRIYFSVFGVSEASLSFGK